MGIFHVLTGPDHLSAIATLSVNVGNFRAFWYGIRWGVGHSIGLVVVASFFLALESLRHAPGDGDDSVRVIEIPQRLEDLAAGFVGLFMLALGLYNVRRARRRRRSKGGEQQCHHEHCHHRHHLDANDNPDLDPMSCNFLTKLGDVRNYGDRNALASNNDEHELPSFNDDLPAKAGDDDPRSDDGNGNNDMKALSLWVGIFHGVAGPGGVLGVVPAVRLRNPWHSAAYLGSFCASSIGVMGIVAASYGSLSATWTRHNDTLAYGVELFSASLSVLVGCLWLVLLYLGVLDDVFP